MHCWSSRSRILFDKGALGVSPVGALPVLESGVNSHGDADSGCASADGGRTESGANSAVVELHLKLQSSDYALRTQ